MAQIGKSLKLKGEITGSEDLYIDGEVEGTVELKGNSLTVGPNGNVHADVSARSITILGRLQGNVKVGERTEIRKTGSFGGELVTAQIVIEDGAVFRGSIDIAQARAERSEHSSGGWPGPHCTEAEGSGYSANRGDHAEPRRFNGPQAVTLAPNGAYVLDAIALNQDFHFGPGTVKVYTRAAPNTTSFRAEPCT